MPRLTRLFLRTALLYLVIGVTLGGIILWAKAVPSAGGAWQLLAAHVSTVTWGWMLQLTLGVAYWILPRAGTERPRAWLAGVAYVTLNAALLLAAVTPWVHIAALSLLSGALQLAGLLAFALHAWPRARRSAYGR